MFLPISFKRFFLAIMITFLSFNAYAKQNLTLLLDWFVNPDHAPIIIAKEKGFFDNFDLDVKIIPPANPNDPPKLVAAQKADLAISYQPQYHMYLKEGLPVKWQGTLVETPLNSLVFLKDNGISAIADLKGKKIGYSVGGFEDILLKNMLSSEGLSLDDVELININFALSSSLVSKKVDAVIGAFRNFELNQLDILGQKAKALYPEEYGIPLYDELILISHERPKNQQAIDAFMSAVEQANAYMLNHPKQAWVDFITAHPDLDDELNKRAFKDTLPRLSRRPQAWDEKRYQRFEAFLEAQE